MVTVHPIVARTSPENTHKLVGFYMEVLILTYYIQCTGKYHESVARIGTSAAGMSTNTGNGRVMFPSTLCVMYLSYGQLCLAGQGDKNLNPKERRATNLPL